jgi:hypothetical protein
VTLGLGIPLASHVKVIFSPSSTVILAALFALIVGATVNLNKNIIEQFHHFCLTSSK